MKANIVIVIGFLIFSCTNSVLQFEENFKGYYYETVIEYHFKKNGYFDYNANGHLGEFSVSGSYLIKDSLILLIPDSELNNGIFKEKLRIINSKCIRDYDANYYCSNELDEHVIDDYNNEEIGFQSHVITILNQIPVVKEEILSLKSSDNTLTLEIVYNGIATITRMEYHRFNLEGMKINSDRIYDQFLVTKSPLKIFRNLNRPDSLILLYE